VPQAVWALTPGLSRPARQGCHVIRDGGALRLLLDAALLRRLPGASLPRALCVKQRVKPL
jgi:hypothetical protein